MAKLICEEKLDDDQERVKFLMQYTETIMTNSEVDLLLLVITLTELTAAGGNITEPVKDFLLSHFDRILKICENFLLQYVYHWAKDDDAFLDEARVRKAYSF